ncbi:N-acetyltransferase [Macrococcoides caseolyticum]|nr:N-acetyltransferase [Macrococcus caseolyticus]
MLMISYEQLQYKDINQLKDYFKHVISHTFLNNGVDDDEDLNNEINKKMTYINHYFNGSDDMFMVAKDGDAVVGIIGFYTPNQMIQELVGDKVDGLKEMGTLYIHPDYQSRGIGSQLIVLLTQFMKEQDIVSYCFDCGYKKAMATWTRKFGQPTYFFKDYWDVGDHYAVWVVDIKETFV